MFFWKTAKETVPERPIRISSVEWRDGQQSLLATRIRTQDMLPILPKMDEVGYECMEMWGGATFDVAIRYLGDDPWERVREFKKLCKKTPLRMLLRGQNLIGYKQYPDDVVEKFVELAAKAGIDKFLVFDGLNDVRNTETAIKAVLKNGKTAEANICYTISPVYVRKICTDGKGLCSIGRKSHSCRRYGRNDEPQAGIGCDQSDPQRSRSSGSFPCTLYRRYGGYLLLGSH